MILDAVLLLLVTVAMQLLKNRFPNFLFFPKGAVLFLPPEQASTQPPKEPKKPKSKVPRQAQINVIRIEYQNVKDYPFSSQLSRVLMTTASLVVFVGLRLVVGLVYKHQALLSFYTLGIILIYVLKLGIDTFLLTNYSRKQCFWFALGLNLLFYLLVLAFDNVQGVFDQTLKAVIADYLKHLEIIFNRELNFITHRSLLVLVFTVNFFVIVAATPAVLKFGNWYSKTLKETYYEDQEGERIINARRADREESDIKEQESRLKEESKETVFKLNFYLGFMLAVIVFSHRYLLNFGSPLFIDAMRAASMGICVSVICSTMNTAIEFNGSFAYKFVLQYFEQQDPEKRKELRKKVSPYIYYIWYHYFQYMVRVLIPLLLFLLLLTWKYLYYESPIVDAPLHSRSLNADIECPLKLDHLTLLENLYRCPANLTEPALTQSHFFLNGVIQSIGRDLPQAKIQQNMQNYSVMTRGIMVELFEQLFWYSSVSIYVMTVLYILFLRKTVYEL